MAFNKGDFFARLSKGKKVSVVNKTVLGNLVGFYKVGESVEVSQIIIELANIAVKSGYKTCIIDANPLSNFYMAKYSSQIQANHKTVVPSMTARFSNSGCSLSECLIDVNSNLKVMCFGAANYNAAYDMNYETVQQLIQEAKSNFDLVLVDIPNIPFLETVVASVVLCNKIYSMWDWRWENVLTLNKLNKLYSIAGISDKLSQTVVCNIPYGTSIENSFKSIDGAKLVCEVPDADISRYTAMGESVLPFLKGKAGTAFAEQMDYIYSDIIDTVGGVE